MASTPDRETRIPELAGLAEVAGLASAAYGRPVSRKRAWQLTKHPDFPEPVQPLAMGPVWLADEVRKFLATERKPGRRHA